jgi:hypothetical protein
VWSWFLDVWKPESQAAREVDVKRTAEELARRLITLIYAGRNRRNMIRRELPRTDFAGWIRRPYRSIFLEGSPFRGPSAVIGAAVQQVFTTVTPPSSL